MLRSALVARSGDEYTLSGSAKGLGNVVIDVEILQIDVDMEFIGLGRTHNVTADALGDVICRRGLLEE